MAHSSSSSTCNEWWKQNAKLVCGGGGGSRIDSVSPVCLCREKYGLRTARTPKNIEGSNFGAALSTR